APFAPEDRVLLGHGSGGRLSQRLFEELILPLLGNPLLERRDDQAVLRGAAGPAGHLGFTTDSFLVTPLFFPAGATGRLAVHGTINALAMAGARPLALSLALILEEGLPLALLRRVLESLAGAAREVGVAVVTGDTKVVPRGAADGLFLNTSGIG